MYHNLDAEMARIGITKGDIAELLGVRYATVVDKTKGRSRFYYDEVLKIRKAFFPNCTIEYLFERNENNQDTA